MENDSHWMDTVSFVFSLLVAGLAGVWLVSSGSFETSVVTSGNLTWYLIRASGISAYVMFTLSVIWGLALTSSAIKDWSPGPVSMVIHATISWLSLIFAAAHGVLLLLDNYFAYRVTDLLIPFTGPYRPFAVGLGIVAFWITLVVTPSFAIKKHLFSYRTWRLLHYTSYAAFMLATAHGLTAGTDGQKLGFRLLFGLSVLLTVILLGYRIGVKQNSRGKHPPARPAPRAASQETP
jgi:sulfoxide reductase heme-binding subunit YedZ